MFLEWCLLWSCCEQGLIQIFIISFVLVCEVFALGVGGVGQLPLPQAGFDAIYQYAHGVPEVKGYS